MLGCLGGTHQTRIGWKMRKIRKAAFPICGLGTRFLPATKSMPKEMLPVVDKPLIQYAVDEAREAGIDQFIFVTSRGKSLIDDHFDHAFELEETMARRGKSLATLDGTRASPGDTNIDVGEGWGQEGVGQ